MTQISPLSEISTLMFHVYSIWDLPGFIVKHRFDKYDKWDPTGDLMVSFQHYNFDAFAFVVDPTTNQSVHIAKFGVLDVIGDFVIHSQDTADTNKFIYDSGNGLVTAEVESRLLQVKIARSAIAKAFAICLFLANWALAVGSVYITALVVSRKLEPNNMVAALPFSALLTIPTIRSLYINSPLLGISIGQLRMPSLSAIRFHDLTYSPRCGGIFRANRNRRVMFVRLAGSPDELSAFIIVPN